VRRELGRISAVHSLALNKTLEFRDHINSDTAVRSNPPQQGFFDGSLPINAVAPTTRRNGICSGLVAILTMKKFTISML
jgi:hypothetical protein